MRALPIYVFMFAGFLMIFANACKQNNETTFEIEEITIKQLQDGYKSGKFSVEDITKAYLKRIAEIDDSGPTLNAVIQINPDALDIAKALDLELKQGKPRGPLHGVPVLLKDNIDTHDKMPNTAGSVLMKNSFPLQDAWVTEKLRRAGAVIIGKTNLSEWANFHSTYSSSGWSALGGQTKNPYDLSRNPCGSSSGSGVAVSANLTAVAIGTETDGSIVCPASNNCIVGIKPTVGLISRSGIIPISFTQDTPGPMARTLTDAVILLGTLTGLDSTDIKTIPSQGKSYTDYTPFLNPESLKGKRIGWDKTSWGKRASVDKVMQQAVDFMKSQGAEVIEISDIIDAETQAAEFEVLLYEFKDGLNSYFKTLGPNAGIKNMEQLIGLQKQDTTEMKWFDHELFELSQQKASLESEEYKKLLTTMLEGAREKGIDRVMNEFQLHAIVSPTSSPAWKTDMLNGDNFGFSSASPAAIAGYPAISLPMGFVHGIPLNLTFFGRAWSEPELIKIAYSFEQGTKHRKKPNFENSAQ